MVVVEGGKCPTPREKRGGIVREGNVRAICPEEYVRGECPDPTIWTLVPPSTTNIWEPGNILECASDYTIDVVVDVTMSQLDHANVRHKSCTSEEWARSL